VIPVTPTIPNRHTRATIRIADACHHQARLITTRTTLNTGIAKTRHATLTWVERNFGYAVARAYAGHTDSGSDTGATTTYIRATPSEVAIALSALTGEPHPLAMPQEGSA
jgi:hypothetical protein